MAHQCRRSRNAGGRAPFVTLAAGQAGTFAFWFTPEGLWLGVLVFAAATLVSIAAWRMQL